MNRTVLLIARREIVSRWQQRAYRIGLGISLLIVVIAVILPSFFGGDDKPASYDIAVTTNNPTLLQALITAGTASGVIVRVHEEGAQQARAQVRSENWDAALLPGPALLANSSDAAVVPFLQGAYAQAELIDRLRRSGLSVPEIRRALGVDPLPVQTTGSADNSQRQTVAIVTVVVLFSQLIAFCTWVATGVVEEKASRVVELLLSSVRPIQLLTGKLLGIGALAAAQVAALAGTALVAATLAGTLTLPVSQLLTVLISFVAFLLGFAFFAALSAGLASTVSRQEEVSGILAPVTVSLTLCYVASFVVASGDSTLARVLSIVPPVSSISMPARIARGQASALDIVLAIVLLLAVTVAMLGVAARVYRASVLHTGSRLKLRQAWRGEAVAEIS